MSPDPTIAHRIIPPPSNRPRVPRVSDLLPYSDMLPGVDNDEMVPPRPHTRDLSLEVGRREDSDGPAHYLSLRTSHGVIETAVVASNDVREVSALVGQRVWRLTDNYHREALGGASGAGSGIVTSSGELAPGWAAVVLDTGDYGLLPEAYVRWFAVEPESPTRAAIATSAAAAAKARLEVRLEAAKAAGVAVGTARGRQEVEEAAAHMEAVMAANRDAIAAAAAVAQRPPPLPPLPPQPPSPPPPVTVTSPTSPPSQPRFTTAAAATPPPQPPQPSQMDRRPMSPGGTTRLTLTPDGKGLAGKTPADLTRAMELLSSLGVSIQAGEGGGGGGCCCCCSDKPAAAAEPQYTRIAVSTLHLLLTYLTTAYFTGLPFLPYRHLTAANLTATNISTTSTTTARACSSQQQQPACLRPLDTHSRASAVVRRRLRVYCSRRWRLYARARAMRHMSKSNLPAYLLEHAMALVTSIGSSGAAAGASEGEGAISEIQFVIAMLLVSKGPPLPEVLPIELQEEILTASVNATASASTIAAPPPPLPPLPPLPVIPKLPKLPPAAAHASTSIFAQLGGREVEEVVEVGDPAPVTETKSKNPFYLEAVAAAAEVVEVSDAAAAETKQSPSPPPQQQPRPWQWTTSDTVEKMPPPPTATAAAFCRSHRAE